MECTPWGGQIGDRAPGSNLGTDIAVSDGPREIVSADDGEHRQPVGGRAAVELADGMGGVAALGG